MKHVFSVQNWVEAGIHGEIRQGKLVADAAKAAGVTHLVYGSAGVLQGGTGVPHFECKKEVEAYMRQLELPLTIIRPAPFMELLRDKSFYPALGAWGVMPRVVGWDLPIPWISVADIGRVIADVFADPGAFIGRDIELIGDVQTLQAAREIFRRVTGKPPFRVPLPVRLFARMAEAELVVMWRWMADWIARRGPAQLQSDREANWAQFGQLQTMEAWLQMTVNGAG